MSRAREAANWIATGVTSTELNKLDGFTGTVDDLNYAKDLRATGVTATEFDKLDGFTGDADDLNYAKDLRATGVTDAEFDQLDTTSGTPGSGNFLRGDKTWTAITMPTTGISDGNTLVANANVADDDFLRVDGTSIEGRTAAETLGDIGAAPLASPTFTGNVALGSNATGTFNGTIGSSATFPSHHIIKVQEKVITTKVRETTVNTWGDLTGFTTDFVTTSASSKILIHGHMTVAGTNDCHVKMARVISGTETDIGIATEDASGTINGGRSLTGNMLTTADYPDHIGWVFIDEPGQASGTTITYKVKYYIGGSGQAFNMNRSNNDLYGTGSSGFVLMEIK